MSMETVQTRREVRTHRVPRKMAARVVAFCAAAAVAIPLTAATAPATPGEPAITISAEPSTLAFYGTTSDGRTYVYGAGDAHLHIANTGDGVLEWSNVTSGSDCDDPEDVPWVGLARDTGQVHAGGPGDEVGIYWHGTADVELANGEYNVRFCMISNDPANPLVTVPLTLTVVDRGDLPLDWLAIEPRRPVLDVGDELQLSVEGAYIDGREFSDVTDDADWTVADESVAIVNPSGVLTAAGPGQTTVSAEYEGRETSASAIVSNPDGEPRISVDPTMVELELPEGYQYSMLAPFTLANTGDSVLTWRVFPGENDCDAPAPPGHWLRYSVGGPRSGEIMPGESEFIQATSVVIRDLAAGEHTSVACVASNDVERPVLEVPIVLTVTEAD